MNLIIGKMVVFGPESPATVSKGMTTHNGSRKNLVLTTIHRLDYPKIFPFFLSLRKTGYQGDIVVFGSQISSNTVRALQEMGVTLIPFWFCGRHVRNPFGRFWPFWKKIFASPAPRPWKSWLCRQVFHLFYLRHLLYFQYLSSRKEAYDRILACDCRDVFFQGDPFQWNQDPGVHFFLEEERTRIGNCPHHQRWLRALFGEHTLKTLSNLPIACAGTTYGDSNSMLKYWERMVSISMQAESLNEHDGDQGVHNFIVHHQLVLPCTVHRNREGPVMTLGPVQFEELQTNSDGQVLDAARKVVPVLHQYDRIPELRKRLIQLLVD